LQDIFEQRGTSDFPVYVLTFSCFCDQLDLTVNTQRAETEEGLDRWQEELNAIVSGTTDVDILTNLSNARGYLQTAQIMLENLSLVLNHTTVSLTTDVAATYRASLNTARTNIIAAQTSITNQAQSISSYGLIADRVADELAKLRSGNSAQSIAGQRAQVEAAQAQVERIIVLIGKNVIVSPINGIVTRQDAKIGQNVVANVVMVGVISAQQLEIESNVPEIDIGKISVGDPITLTVDALPNEKLRAHVKFIEPGETIVEGVVNFKILATLDMPDDRLKSGLTVNLDIESEHKDGVLLLPQVAIIENDQGTFVRRLDGTDIRVTTGIRSQEGMVEIISGLQEGDRVENIGLK